MTTTWLDPEEMRAWRGLVEVHAGVMADLEADLVARHDLTGGDYGVLVALSEAPDQRLRMCDLADALHLSPSGLTRRLDGLVKRGLVERTPAPDDRRVILAAITATGLAKLMEAAPDHVDAVRHLLLDHLSREQLTALADALDTIRAHRAAHCPGRVGAEQAVRTWPAPA